MATRTRDRVTVAAGTVAWRPSTAEPGRLELLVIHRPRYDDWSFPKGKQDRGEFLARTAVRETFEESGVQTRLGAPIGSVSYRVNGGVKQVHYWTARVVQTRSFLPNEEVDELRWVRPREARSLLSYEHDLQILDAFREARNHKAHKTRTLIVQRHAQARARGGWTGEDIDRPLTKGGRDRANRLVELLDAYGVREIVSSDARRCVQTVEPYVESSDGLLRLDQRLAEGSKPKRIRRSVEDLLGYKRPVVACTHRTVLPHVFGSLGLSTPELEPGEAIVVHHRGGRVFATEHVTA